MNTKDNPVILSKGIAACGIVTHDNEDIYVAETVISLEYLKLCIKHAEQEIKAYRKLANNRHRIDQTQIEVKLFNCKNSTCAEPAIHLRFKPDTDPVVPREPIRFYALAPVVQSERFKDYDQHYTDEQINDVLDQPGEDVGELMSNGMFRNREHNGEPISGSDADCNRTDAQDIQDCADQTGMKPT